MQNSIFVVNEEPYCIWEVDIRPGPRQTGLNEGLNCVDLA